MEKLAFPIKEAVIASGLARSRIYELLGTGHLEGRKAGRRTLVLGDSLRNYIASLPAAKISAPKIVA